MATQTNSVAILDDERPKLVNESVESVMKYEFEPTKNAVNRVSGF